MIDMLAANSGRVTNLTRVTYIVMDEADRMFDLGNFHRRMIVLTLLVMDRQKRSEVVLNQGWLTVNRALCFWKDLYRSSLDLGLTQVGNHGTCVVCLMYAVPL